MKLITKHLIPLLLILFFSTSLQAQNKVIDSLENELLKHKAKDTTSVYLLNTLAYNYYRKDHKKFKEYIDKAYLLTKEISYTKGEARNLYLQAILFTTTNELENGITKVHESVLLYEKIKDETGISSCYDLLGTIKQFQGNYKESIHYYKKSLKIAIKNGKKQDESDTKGNIGGLYIRTGDYEKALKYLKESLHIDDSLNSGGISGTLINIGIIYKRQGKYAQALDYFQKGLYNFTKEGNKTGIAAASLNMGNIYLSLEDYDNALRLFNEALAINKELENNFEIVNGLINIGNTYKNKKQYEKSLQYYKKAKEIADKQNNLHQKNSCFYSLGNIYNITKKYDLALFNFKKSLDLALELDQKRSIAISYISVGIVYYNIDNYKKSFEYATKGKKIAEDLSLIEHLKKANFLLSNLHEKKGNHKEALHNFKEYKKLTDSIFNKENIQKLTALEYEYKYQKERDSLKINELQLTKTITDTTNDLRKSKRNLLYGIIIFLVAALLMGSVIFFLKLRNEKAKTQNAIVAQKLLRSQMTPHFIFNSLSVLQGMILHKEEKNSVAYLSKFSKLLRTILENSRHKTVLLSEELAAIDDYMALQNLDEIPPYQYTLTVAPEIDTSTLKIPPMLIQPFIENAIEHAFPYKKEDKKITVTLSFKGEKLTCIVEDNGVGIDMVNQSLKNNTHKNSLATTITSERLKTLSKDLKKEGSITIKNKKSLGAEGTLVTLVIPYLTEELEPLRISLPEK